MPFTCSICEEESTQICVRCTKDACDNHLCQKCRRCSDCCECEVPLAEPAPATAPAVYAEPVATEVGPIPPLPPTDPQPPPPDPEPQPPHPPPDPDPVPIDMEPGEPEPV